MILICADRDGTLNRDENQYLGSKPDWKSNLTFLPGVIAGIKLLNTIPDSKFVIVTNQAGVALEGPDFELLTEERAHEVNQHIIAALKDLDCRVDGYCFCPYVTHEYAHNAALKGRSVSPNYIDDKARCLKPSIGMFEDAAKLFGKTFSELQHTYMIGDRAVDIEMGLRGGCVSILVESSKTRELGDLKKVLAMQEKFPDAVFIAADFLAAAVQIRDMCYTSLI